MAQGTNRPERILAAVEVWRDIFYAVWDVVVLISAVVMGFIVAFNDQLQDPKFLASLSSIYGISYGLRLAVWRKRKGGGSEPQSADNDDQATPGPNEVP